MKSSYLDTLGNGIIHNVSYIKHMNCISLLKSKEQSIKTPAPSSPRAYHRHSPMTVHLIATLSVWRWCCTALHLHSNKLAIILDVITAYICTLYIYCSIYIYCLYNIYCYICTLYIGMKYSGDLMWTLKQEQTSLDISYCFQHHHLIILTRSLLAYVFSNMDCAFS